MRTRWIASPARRRAREAHRRPALSRRSLPGTSSCATRRQATPVPLAAENRARTQPRRPKVSRDDTPTIGLSKAQCRQLIPAAADDSPRSGARCTRSRLGNGLRARYGGQCPYRGHDRRRRAPRDPAHRRVTCGALDGLRSSWSEAPAGNLSDRRGVHGGISTAASCCRAPALVAVANPRQVRDFAKAFVILAKTDRLDAQVIALIRSTQATSDHPHNPRKISPNCNSWSVAAGNSSSSAQRETNRRETNPPPPRKQHPAGDRCAVFIIDHLLDALTNTRHVMVSDDWFPRCAELDELPAATDQLLQFGLIFRGFRG